MLILILFRKPPPFGRLGGPARCPVEMEDLHREVFGDGEPGPVSLSLAEIADLVAAANTREDGAARQARAGRRDRVDARECAVTAEAQAPLELGVAARVRLDEVATRLGDEEAAPVDCDCVGLLGIHGAGTFPPVGVRGLAAPEARVHGASWEERAELDVALGLAQARAV